MLIYRPEGAVGTVCLSLTVSKGSNRSVWFFQGTFGTLRKEGRAWLAVVGIILNGLFALFHLLIVMLAG